MGTPNDSYCTERSVNQSNITHILGAQTVDPVTHTPMSTAGPSAKVLTFGSTLSPLVSENINFETDFNNFDIENRLQGEGQRIENITANQQIPRQSPQPSTSTAVESYQRPLVLQPNARNNTQIHQRGDLDDNAIDDIIHTIVNKINLGLITPNGDDPLLGKLNEMNEVENMARLKGKTIREELKQPGRLQEFLNNTGWQQEAIMIANMFRMDDPWKYGPTIELRVINASILRSGNSRYFKMDSRPRGRAIVFVTTDGLKDEVDRWKSIFKQLDFKCDTYRDVTCSQIRTVMMGMSGQRFNADALIVMVIGGGNGGKIYGFGEGSDNEMSFTEIVDSFSDTNCGLLTCESLSTPSISRELLSPSVACHPFPTYSDCSSVGPGVGSVLSSIFITITVAMSGYRECGVCGLNSANNMNTKIGENYVPKGSGIYTCEKDRQWFYKNAKLTEVCPNGQMSANDLENCDIQICRPCKLHKCLRIGMRLKQKPHNMPQNSASPTKRYRNNTIDDIGIDLNQWSNGTVGGKCNYKGQLATISGFNGYTAQSYSQSLNSVTNNGFETQQWSGCNLASIHPEVGQEIENMNAIQDILQQSLEPSANTSTTVESYETNATNNILMDQTDDSHDKIINDMIHTLINKINLGQQMIKEIADELKREGQGRFKQLLDTAGLRLREAEDVLKMFITKEPWECTTDVELKVTKASKLRSGDSRYFQMNSHPRGRAIIFVTTDGLNVEILRWYSIFAQLDFKCEIYVDFSCSQIKDNLLGVSCQRLAADALFVMVIGGGFDQKIYGYGNRGVDNEMSFTEIVDIFSANNPKSDVSLRMKPKIFVFNTFSIAMNLWRNPDEDAETTSR
ncbi:unnamed protein product [Oppiella nova]|uniref:Uncharacterized protein n=1 Tax=Oppiella nova TaxID=334625 RepID=A0A7R9LNI5_9ACAR|nr:unnamed protein product [Oppiella nova]CAG2164732.1 unnamed protein product [Oppiella nova]